MFIRQLDYLSPRVTFYHKGFLSHNSILSGILSIITIIFVLVLAIYYFLEIILREKPNGYYFPTFVVLFLQLIVVGILASLGMKIYFAHFVGFVNFDHFAQFVDFVVVH